MSEFTLYNMETAKEEVKPMFERSLKAFSMIPNLHAVMAEAPQLLDSYQHIHDSFQKTSFNAEELTVVWQTINIFHQCHYCVPAHALIESMMNVSGITDALKKGEKLADPKLEVLRETTVALTENRGNLTAEEKQKFYDAGYANQQLLEIVLGIAQKVMSNFTNSLADTPIDAPFQKFA